MVRIALTTTIEDIPLNKLKISEQNVRQDVGDVSELAQSVAEKGVLQPILVRPEDGSYGVIIGSRRYTAAKEAKLRTIPATVKEMNDDEALLVSLTENIQRNDILPKETAIAIDKLLKDMTLRDLGKKLGKSHMYIQNMHNIVNLVYKLDDHSVKVEYYPADFDRQRGKALPVNHAIHLADALNEKFVKKHLQTLPEEEAENIQVELAKAIAPLNQVELKKGLEYFRERPFAPVEEIVQIAQEPEFGGAGGGGLGGSITQTAVQTIASDSDLVHSKTVYNLKRIDLSKYKFFTIGYSHTTIDQFIEKLKIAGVKTVIDVRHNPQSMYRYEFNKESLESTLKAKGIRYLHVREMGVPSEQREDLSSEKEYEKLWKWYDKHVLYPFMTDNSRSHDLRQDITPPFAYMCMELDPTKCHRHRIALWHEEKGQKGLDL
jgi:ParB/RepB/Spo0J family partition protein